MTRVGWASAAEDFEPDGSLRDIYVLDTTIADWQRVLDHLRDAYGPMLFEIDGTAAPLPSHVEEIFDLRARATPTLSFRVSELRIACHFFWEREIEFDFPPDDVAGPEQLESLTTFMTMLGTLTDKAVLVTPENLIGSPILSFDPNTGEVLHVPPSDAPAL